MMLYLYLFTLTHDAVPLSIHQLVSGCYLRDMTNEDWQLVVKLKKIFGIS